MNKLKTFFIIYLSCTVFFFLAFSMSVYQKEDKLLVFYISAMFAVLLTGFFYLTNLYKILLDYFDNNNLDRQKLAYETRANILLERLRNNAEINKAKVAAKLEIERMIQEKELQKDYLVFEKYCDIFFRLLERDLGLNVMELNAEQIERYAAEAFEQLGLLDG